MTRSWHDEVSVQVTLHEDDFVQSRIDGCEGDPWHADVALHASVQSPGPHVTSRAWHADESLHVTAHELASLQSISPN
jgi:hypothetical protein